MSKVEVSELPPDEKKPDFYAFPTGTLVRVTNDPGGGWKHIIGFKMGIYSEGAFFIYRISSGGVGMTKYSDTHPLSKATFEVLPPGTTFTITQE